MGKPRHKDVLSMITAAIGAAAFLDEDESPGVQDTEWHSRGLRPSQVATVTPPTGRPYLEVVADDGSRFLLTISIPRKKNAKAQDAEAL